MRRYGNRLASWLFRRAFKMPVQDVTSGFRAFSRESLLKLNVVGDYTYTLDSLIQAARKRLAVRGGDPRAAEAVRESRTSCTPSAATSARRERSASDTTLHSSPLAVFGRAALISLVAAMAFMAWFLVGYGDGGMHLPALLATLIAFGLSGALFLSGLIADGVNTNRRLLEDALYRLKRLEADLGTEDREPWAMHHHRVR